MSDLAPQPSRLKPIPNLSFDPVKHQYTYLGKPVQWSTTAICSHDMDPTVYQRIQETKHIWEPRGTTIHNCLEARLNGEPEIDPGDYAEWVEPLLDHPLWKRYAPIAVEHRMVSSCGTYAGSLDSLLRGRDRDGKEQTLLVDLKTLSSARGRPRSIARQAGSYITMLNDRHKIAVDRVIGVFSMPGRVELKVEEPADCLAAWQDCLEKFHLFKPEW